METQSQPTQFSVRAIPPMGFDSRHRAGRKWGKDAIIVKVVDVPTPPRVDKDRDGKDIVVHSNEISPADLEVLKADRFFAVVPVGANGPASSKENELKVALAKAEDDLAEARKEIAGLREEIAQYRTVAQGELEKAGAKVAAAEAEAANAKAQLSTASKRSAK
jgi:hypothetical protein